MKKLFLLSIMLLSVLFVNAQKNAETIAQNKVNRLTKQLNLSDAQQGQVYELLVSQYENKKAKGKVNRSELTQEQKEAMKAERKAAKTAFDNRMANILTDEQLATYNAAGKKRNKKARGKGNADRPSKAGRSDRSNRGDKANRPAKTKKSQDEKIQKRVDRMSEELGLNDRQKQQMADLYASGTPQTKGKSRKDLTEAERTAIKAERKQAKAEMDSAVAEILTPEQLAKYKTMKKGKKRGGKKAKRADRVNKVEEKN